MVNKTPLKLSSLADVFWVPGALVLTLCEGRILVQTYGFQYPLGFSALLLALSGMWMHVNRRVRMAACI